MLHKNFRLEKSKFILFMIKDYDFTSFLYIIKLKSNIILIYGYLGCRSINNIFKE